MSIMTLPQLVGDHDDPRILHSLWCREHVNYDPERSPQHGLCTMPFEVEFPGAVGIESVRSAKLDLSFAAADAAAQHESTFGFLAINGGSELQIEAWKLVPVAYTMLAAEAQSRGETEQAERFMAFARTAVSAHLTEVAA